MVSYPNAAGFIWAMGRGCIKSLGGQGLYTEPSHERGTSGEGEREVRGRRYTIPPLSFPSILSPVLPLAGRESPEERKALEKALCSKHAGLSSCQPQRLSLSPSLEENRDTSYLITLAHHSNERKRERERQKEDEREEGDIYGGRWRGSDLSPIRPLSTRLECCHPCRLE